MLFSLDNLGKTAFESGDLEKAEKIHREAKQIYLDHEIDLVYARYCFINLGVVLLEKGDQQGAWEAFRRALDYAWNGSYIPQVLEILAHTAEIIHPAHPDLAAELLQVVKTHPRTTVIVHENTDRLVETLGAVFLEESQPPSLEEIIPRVLETLDQIYS
jgi:tetratricopeptide (TPR) repeat protein